MRTRKVTIPTMAVVAGYLVAVPALPAQAAGFGQISGQIRESGTIVVDAFEDDSNGADFWSPEPQTAKTEDEKATARASQEYQETYRGADLKSLTVFGVGRASVASDKVGFIAESASQYFLQFQVSTGARFDATGTVTASQSGVDDANAAGGFVEMVGVFLAEVSGPGSDGVSTSGTLPPGSYTVKASAQAGVGRGQSARGSFDLTLVLTPCDKPFTAGNDTIDGTPGNDVLCGGDGNDTINGKGGDDQIFGGENNDTILGRDGNDTLEGEAGRDTIYGGDNRDTIRGGADSDGKGNTDQGSVGELCGGLGPDTIEGGSGSDTVRGFECEGQFPPISTDSAIDNLSGGPGHDVVNDVLGGGENVLNGDEGDDQIRGGEDADNIGGGLDNDEIFAGEGRDEVVQGGDGDDLIEGGKGRDRLTGGRGSDKLRGQAEGDTLLGNQRKDVLNGGDDNDVLNACDGVLDDVIGGNGGDDHARVDPGVDNVAPSTEVVNDC